MGKSSQQENEHPPPQVSARLLPCHPVNFQDILRKLGKNERKPCSGMASDFPGFVMITPSLLLFSCGSLWKSKEGLLLLSPKQCLRLRLARTSKKDSTQSEALWRAVLGITHPAGPCETSRQHWSGLGLQRLVKASQLGVKLRSFLVLKHMPWFMFPQVS